MDTVSIGGLVIAAILAASAAWHVKQELSR
jgi:hypothetical protein